VGVHEGAPEERELLWAAALLHDIGMAIDYDDHHRHSRYLILNGGLPGFTPREVALIALMARYHRKGDPGLGDLAPLMNEGDDDLLNRCAAVLRLAEQLDRSRDGLVRDVRLRSHDGRIGLDLDTEGDASVARWGAERQADLFKRAFGRELVVGG
jgi:exopolyphosphatase/guanosine-5'-triphosphate,3'-diphosphate pyrophosphatase